MAFKSREFADLQDFHAKFAMHHNTRPGFLEHDLMQFRVNFLQEELDETVAAIARGDLAGAADGLVDLVYVAIGTAEIMGLPWSHLWDAVQRANMAKVRAIPGQIEGHRLSKYDVVKPEGWTPPNIERILEEALHYDRDSSIERRDD
jgi:predicted HAD superfamily Cof-like phosphohydrolase